MANYELHLPADFDEYEWQAEVKGWFGDAKLAVAGAVYELIFYDQTRLAQEIADELSSNPAFVDENLIVLRKVTRCEIENAVRYIVEKEKYRSLTPAI